MGKSRPRRENRLTSNCAGCLLLSALAILLLCTPNSVLCQASISPSEDVYTVETLVGSFLTNPPVDVDGSLMVARLRTPTGVALSSDKTTLYFTEEQSSVVRKVLLDTGEVTTIAGLSGTPGDVNAVGSAARFSGPRGCALNPAGTALYVADSGNYKIKAINLTTWAVWTVTGTGVSGSDGGSLLANGSPKLRSPQGLDFTEDGQRLIIADADTIRIFNMSNDMLYTVAMRWTNGSAVGVGTFLDLRDVKAWTFPNNGTTVVWISDSNNKIWACNLDTGYVTTIAGDGVQAQVDGFGTAARLNSPMGLWISPDYKYVYFTETQGGLRTLDTSTREVRTVAGSSIGRVNGPGTSAAFNGARFLAAFVPPGTAGIKLYVADMNNNEIRTVTITPTQSPPPPAAASPPPVPAPPPDPSFHVHIPLTLYGNQTCCNWARNCLDMQLTCDLSDMRMCYAAHEAGETLNSKCSWCLKECEDNRELIYPGNIIKVTGDPPRQRYDRCIPQVSLTEAVNQNTFIWVVCKKTRYTCLQATDRAGVCDMSVERVTDQWCTLCRRKDKKRFLL